MALSERVGFFTDSSICIGCKACEVACKEWNHVPEDGLDFLAMSYDNTGALGASTWRHVAFIEQRRSSEADGEAAGEPGKPVHLLAVSHRACAYSSQGSGQLEVDVGYTGATVRSPSSLKRHR